jgi:hypothetical protein
MSDGNEWAWHIPKRGKRMRHENGKKSNEINVAHLVALPVAHVPPGIPARGTCRDVPRKCHASATVEIARLFDGLVAHGTSPLY